MDLVQDLKLDIFDLKKVLATSKEVNQLLKVKIRKLENEVRKKDRQIESLLDPRKSAFVGKVISEKGASVLINLRERNLKLEKSLLEKDLLIKRLQSDLQTKKLYTIPDKSRKSFRHSASNRCEIAIPDCDRILDSDLEREDTTLLLEHDLKSISMYDVDQSMENLCLQCHSARSTAMQRAVSVDRAQFTKHTNKQVKAQYEGLSRANLLSIIESLKNSGRKLSPWITNRTSPQSDLETLCDTPRLEIQQLQNYFMDMLAEVDRLKATIADLKSDEDKTVWLLKQKDKNVVKLEKEVDRIKRQSESEMKSSESNSSYLHNSCKKPTCHSVKNNWSIGQGQTTTRVMATDETTEEEEMNVYTYTEAAELKPQQKEDNLQVIQTRTISIQKFEDKTKYNNQTVSRENELVADFEQQTFQVEESTRRAKFNNLLEELLQKKNGRSYSLAATDYSNDHLQAEYK